MKKTILLAALLLILSTANAFSFEVAWMHVQSRTYSPDKNYKRLGFGLIDEQGRYITSQGKIKKIKLFDPNGKVTKLSPHKFSSVEELYGSYDFKNSQWRYTGSWQYDSWFAVEILEPLTSGKYRLEVISTDGKKAWREYSFHSVVRLPTADSSSFLLKKDTYGNVLWTWDIPEEMGEISTRHRTRARASIDIFDKGRNAGYFSVILPSHMSYIFIPSEIIKKLGEKGQRFELKVQFETRDKNSRTYSNPLSVESSELVLANK